MKNTKIKVIDADNLVRDQFSKSIINVDRNSYLQAKARKKAHIEKNNMILKLQDDLNLLQNRFDALEMLVKKLAARK